VTKEKIKETAHRLLQLARRAPDKRIAVPAKVFEFLYHRGMKEERSAEDVRAERLEVASKIAASMIGMMAEEEDAAGAVFDALRAADLLIAEVDRKAASE